MKNEQNDKLVKSKLATDILPESIRFDKEAAWGRLEQRLPAAKKQRVPLYRMAAAACVLLCVTIGLYPYLQPKAVIYTEPHTVQSNTNKHQLFAPPPAHVIPVPPARINTAHARSFHRNEPQAGDTQVAVAAIVIPVADTAAVAVSEPEIPAVKKMKTVHITDVYNEERETQRIMNDREHMATGRSSLFHSGFRAAPQPSNDEPLTN